MTVTRVLVVGAAGRMGRQVIRTILDDPALSLVAAVDHHWQGQDAALALGDPTPCGVQAVARLSDLPSDLQADVGIEFTHAQSVEQNVQALITRGIRPLIGATGLTQPQLQQLDVQLQQAALAGAFVANFSIGAVLMMRFAREAAQYFNHAELIELHHNQKADAPSGTALHTAKAMTETVASGQFGVSNLQGEKELLPGARGAQTEAGLHIHSVRLPGLFAHQEVLLAGPGQLLTIRHDSFDRACYMPGVALATKKLVQAQPGLIQGLDAFLD